jgi:hypothetical protein
LKFYSLFRTQLERAGRSVWYDRRLRKAEAAGSNPAQSTSTIDLLGFKLHNALT